MTEGPPGMPNRVGCAGRGCLTMFFAFFLLAGLIAVGFIGYEFLRAVDTYAWEPVPCTVTRSEVVTRDNDESPYVLELAYTYEYGGRDYPGEAWSTGELASADYTTVARQADRLAEGRETVCYVDESDPSRAILEHPRLWFVLILPLPLIFVLIGGGGVYFAMGGRWPGSRKPAAAVQERRAETPAAKPASGAGITWIICWAFILIGGLAFYFMFIRPVAGVIAARDWVQTPCKVITSRVRQYEHTDDEGRTRTTYRADILYEYTIGGRTYRSNRLDFTGMSTSGYESKAKLVRAHPPGAQKRCWVDPQDPYEAALDRSLRPTTWIGLIPAAFMLGGLLGLYAMRRKS
jgi:hypothetical protein